MALRSIAQLKTWFRKGAYPLASQFADWMDSYWHKDEKIPIDAVGQLAERLNEKFEASSGEELQHNIERLSEDYGQHRKDNEADIKQINEELDALAEEDERLSGVIAAETARATEEEGAIRQAFADADMQEQAAREQKDAETLRAAKDYTDAVRHDERAVREEAEQAIREAVSAYVDRKVAELVNGSPEALDTLLEISEALGNNPNFAADILATLGGKVDKAEGKGLSTEDYTTDEKAKLAAIAEGAAAVSVRQELGSGTKIATITVNGVAYDLYCQTSVDATYTAGTGIDLDGTKFSLSPSGVAEGTYGPAADVAGTDGQTIAIPQITVDPYGRVTSVTDRILTNKNTTYTHPAGHPASMIEEDATRRFVSDSEKTSWNSAVSQLGDIAAALDKING